MSRTCIDFSLNKLFNLNLLDASKFVKFIRDVVPPLPFVLH